MIGGRQREIDIPVGMRDTTRTDFRTHRDGTTHCVRACPPTSGGISLGRRSGLNRDSCGWASRRTTLAARDPDRRRRRGKAVALENPPTGRHSSACSARTGPRTSRARPEFIERGIRRRHGYAVGAVGTRHWKPSRRQTSFMMSCRPPEGRRPEIRRPILWRNTDRSGLMRYRPCAPPKPSRKPVITSSNTSHDAAGVGNLAHSLEVAWFGQDAAGVAHHGFGQDGCDGIALPRDRPPAGRRRRSTANDELFAGRHATGRAPGERRWAGGRVLPWRFRGACSNRRRRKSRDTCLRSGLPSPVR